MGSIASPALKISPLETIKRLWGDELPAFDSMDNLNELLNVLANGLWNQLTAHQSSQNPFPLTAQNVSPTHEGLRQYVQVRQQEIEGFVEGLFGSHETLDLPESAHQAVKVLGDVRSMLAGAVNLLNDPSKPAQGDDLKGLLHSFKEIAKIAEVEMNAAIQSCKRARDQGTTARQSLTRPTLH